MRELVLNRATYKDIKKYNHNQMSDFLTKYYQLGYNDGVSDACIDYDELKSALLSVKGIGEKKANDIIIELMRGEDNECVSDDGKPAI